MYKKSVRNPYSSELVPVFCLHINRKSVLVGNRKRRSGRLSIIPLSAPILKFGDQTLFPQFSESEYDLNINYVIHGVPPPYVQLPCGRHLSTKAFSSFLRRDLLAKDKRTSSGYVYLLGFPPDCGI